MIEVIKSAGWFVVAIGVLVAFHEYGHFWVARRLGVKVLRYSIGFGPVLLKRTAADGCEYALSAIPLGGYVKMLDEREGEVAEADLPKAFNRQPPWKRFLIVAAGPLANLILAVVFFWMVLVIGQPGMKPVLEQPAASSVAAQAGIQRGELISEVNGEAVATWTQLRTLLLEQVVNRTPLKLTLRASNQSDAASRTVDLPLTSVRVDPEWLFSDLGLEPFQPTIEPVLESIDAGSAAEQSGFRPGDRLLARDGQPLTDWQAWAIWVRAHAGSVTRIDFQRDGQTLSKQVLIGEVVDGAARQGRFGARVKVSDALWQSYRTHVRLSPLAAVPAAFDETARMTVLTVKLLGRIFTGDVSLKNISGPVGTAQAANYSAQSGVATFLKFLAFVSISLGVMNLLPVPVLDGGHLVFTSIEMVRGAPLSERTLMFGQRLGLTFLALLMGLAFYNDFSRLIG